MRMAWAFWYSNIYIYFAMMTRATMSAYSFAPIFSPTTYCFIVFSTRYFPCVVNVANRSAIIIYSVSFSPFHRTILTALNTNAIVCNSPSSKRIYIALYLNIRSIIIFICYVSPYICLAFTSAAMNGSCTISAASFNSHLHHHLIKQLDIDSIRRTRILSPVSSPCDTEIIQGRCRTCCTSTTMLDW